jgi:hypothetical protein
MSGFGPRAIGFRRQANSLDMAGWPGLCSESLSNE